MEAAAGSDSHSSKVDSRSEDSSEARNDDAGTVCAAPVAPDQLLSRASNSVFKSGYLYISSKGIGWTSWKKRWFILTRTSLVFFRSDPNGLPQKGGEVNLTLGGIDLNSSGSVVVRADKKLLTVLFPDGRDGRAFTLKTETSEDLQEWKTALENALAQAPSATLVMGQRGIFRNDVVEECWDQSKDNKPGNSMVVGRPVLLALEEVDGTPSFLEKALRFIEEFGIKVEGILRQSADVEEVEQRVQEYEQGNDEFSQDEDAHVVADCIKHVLRELPCSPVSAPCCSSLLEAFRSERATRIHAMRSVISGTFPDANRHLLQRVLKMMRIVVSHKADNRMSTSAVAACMAPLLLRPLVAGECNFDDDFHLNGDGSLQLLQAAAAANHAQAIIIILLEEYHNIFSNEDPLSVELYSASESCYTEEEEFTDDEYLEDDEDAENDSHSESENDDDDDRTMSGSISERSEDEGSVRYSSKDVSVQDTTGSNETDRREHFNGEAGPWLLPVKDFEIIDLGTESAKVGEQSHANDKSSFEEKHSLLPQSDVEQITSNSKSQINEDFSISAIGGCDNSPIHLAALNPDLSESPKSISASEQLNSTSARLSKKSSSHKSLKKSNNESIVRRQAILGRTSARKNLSMESIDLSDEDGIEIQKLEISKNDLQKKLAREAEEISILQTSLDRRKQALRERRLALEQEVLRLQEQLQRERELRAALVAGLGMPAEKCLSDFLDVDIKTRVGLEEVALAEADITTLKEKVRDLQGQLNQQLQDRRHCESCGQTYSISNIESSQKLEPKCTKSSAGKHIPLQAEKNVVTIQNLNSLINSSPQKQHEGDYVKNTRVPEANLFQPMKHTNLTNTNYNLKGMESTTVSANKSLSQKQQISRSANVSSKSTNAENVAVKDKDQPNSKRKGRLSYLSRENNSPKSAPCSGGAQSAEEKPARVQINAGLSMEEVLKDPSTSSKKNKGTNTSSSNEDVLFAAPASSSKKVAGRNEVQNASSALSRLTNRFNFRRERRASSNEFPIDACLLPHIEPSAPSRTNSR